MTLQRRQRGTKRGLGEHEKLVLAPGFLPRIQRVQHRQAVLINAAGMSVETRQDADAISALHLHGLCVVLPDGFTGGPALLCECGDVIVPPVNRMPAT